MRLPPCRTAVGRFQGSLTNIRAVDLGAAVIRQLLAQTGLRMGHASMVDSMISDGLWDAFNVRV